MPNKSPPKWKPLPAKQAGSYGLRAPSKSPPRAPATTFSKIPTEKPRASKSPFSLGSKIIKSQASNHPNFTNVTLPKQSKSKWPQLNYTKPKAMVQRPSTDGYSTA